MLIRKNILSAIIYSALGLGLLSCGSEDYDSGEEWAEPTQGLITTVEEVEPDNYKIASEETVPSPVDSRVIVNDLDGSSDTFTLQEVKLIEQTASDTSHVRRPFRSAMMGYWGFMMLGRMGSTPSSSAYVNNNAYQRTTSTTGSRLSSTARTGFGGSAGKSTRSFGG